jgi:hypothetical protein
VRHQAAIGSATAAENAMAQLPKHSLLTLFTTLPNPGEPMKKNLLALSLSLGGVLLCAGGAHAQISVEVSGLVDVFAGSIKNSGDAGRKSVVDSGGLTTSWFGFKGTEDLGGGSRPYGRPKPREAFGVLEATAVAVAVGRVIAVLVASGKALSLGLVVIGVTSVTVSVSC